MQRTALLSNALRLTASLACILLVLLTGCTSSRPAAPSSPPVKPPVDREEYVLHEETAAPEIPAFDLASDDALIRAEVDRYFGIPHRMGGTDERGFDCSGFVLVLYRDLFGVTLPRTTSDQVEAGFEITPEELEPGDLVFFKPPKTQHVGIYVGNGEFAHASSSKGVMISRLSEAYWKRAYWTSRRVREAEVERIEAAPRTTGFALPVNPRGIDLPAAELKESAGSFRSGW